VHREQRRPAAARNDIWSMDFVADELTEGRRFRTLTVLDLFTRQCLDIAVGRGLTGQDVVATLERLRFDRGLPQRIYCDNGSNLSAPPWISGRTRTRLSSTSAIESFNGRFRDECLNVHWFESLEDASRKIEAWRQDYNANHPHRALKGLSPNEYARLTMEPAAESL
jgi:putative transposase